MAKRPAEDEPSAKRQKVESVQSKFYEGLFDDANQETLRKTFAESKPYLHCKIDKLINNDLLERVRKEIFDNLHFTVKETDIYKVHQTGDLANLDGLPQDELKRLSSLFELRNALYSQEFRDFIAAVTDSGPLSGTKTDMSINSYYQGCHLLNHDDVIGTRRVSYILYLVDPWEPKDGGALELYPVVEKGIPANEPTVIIPPQWNQFVMFTVQPGHSFHSVEEVVANKARLSISGWFHVPQEGEPGYEEGQAVRRQDEAAQSSLQQLQADTDSSDKFTRYTHTDVDEALTEEDIRSLSAWMNPHYLDMKILKQMADKFYEESAVQLKEIVNPELAEALRIATTDADRALQKGDEMPPHGSGVGQGWTTHGPPHRCRYLVADSDASESSKLMRSLQGHLESDAFRRWLAIVGGLEPQGYRGEARRFRPGHDYTLATTNTRGQGVLDVTLCLAPAAGAEERELWDNGEVGGYECYMAPHDDEEDPATYKAADEDGALLTLTAGWNELSLVLRDEGVMRFTKYVSTRAPGSRWDLAYEYDLPEEDDEEEDKAE